MTLEPITIPTDDDPIIIERSTLPDSEEAQEFFDAIGYHEDDDTDTKDNS